ncbi:transcriptional repressor, CopY family [Caldicellulosiruptor acetigenus I77R1B]|uniref:Transcriptional repressor, CopY family n=1 Tax=Caldicellulosiruptor acetigenus (strain ATCC 700853 / DSM 12137 / I77R1B) TaxID=632335 RepID=E4S994_CALA7|nr:BlaI/MecI/CopY family transcriptional regulator [Caldicellulosiruptor acetigenus]ADQ40017.1 transcriptional repressor, CopY family [Caldicellulosiruptor acetigenus I77R1B]
MKKIKIFDAEYRFMNIIWKHAPITSTELVKIANKELGWKKSTTYTVIRRLSERGIIKNENAIVYALINREDVILSETKEHIDRLYNGSLKLFFTTFLQKQKMTKDEIEELKKIIEKYGEDQ